MNRRKPIRKARKRASRKTGPGEMAETYACLLHLLSAHYRSIAEHEPGVVLGQRIPLHDLRVALRRLRLLLRIFRPLLKTTSASHWERELDHLSHSLGSARDIDVWLHFLSANGRAMTRQDIRFLNRQAELKQRQLRRVSRLLTGRRYLALKAGLSRLLHREIPRLSTDGPGLKKIGRKAIRKRLEQALARYDDAAPSFRPEPTHRLRIACRKARYACEFFAPAFGKPIGKLGDQLKDLQSLLGRVHDMDVWDALLARQQIPPQSALRRSFARQRRAEIKRFPKGWKRLDVERRIDEL